MADYEIERVISPPFEEVSYVLWKPGREDALVVDPGFDPRTILRLLDKEELSVAAILNTHGHVDHIAGNRAIKEVFRDAPLVIGQGEQHLLTDAEANLSAGFGLPITSPPADRTVADLDRIEYAGFSFLVREIPGHSPGSVVFVCEEAEPPFLLGGDVLFAGSVGRTDLGGDFALLARGIRGKLWTLPERVVVYPGHGPATTIGHERQSNPFVGVHAGQSETAPGEP